MARLEISGFGGQAPRISPALIQANMATRAMNADLTSGEIRPIKDWRRVNLPAKPGYIETIYGYEGTYWLHWLARVNVVRSPITDDETRRLYFTGAGKPQITTLSMATTGGTSYPVASRDLGIPAPEVAPTVTNGAGGVSTIQRNVVYVYTYVSDLGEEGPPSPASTILLAKMDDVVQVSALAIPAGTTYITAFRIYRSETGSKGSTAFQFVAEVQATATNFTDDVRDIDLGERLVTKGHVAPPEALQGLISLPGGTLAGFVGNEVCISAEYAPHAWPVATQYALDYPVVALGCFGTYIVALTQNQPYLIAVGSPNQVQIQKLPDPAGCVSAAGVVSTDLGVIFPTANGLYLVGEGQTGLIARDILTRLAWASYMPATIRACVYDGKYYGFYRTGVGNNGDILGRGFVFDTAEPAAKFVELDFYAHALFVDPQSGKLYFVTRTNGVNSINEWGASPLSRTYTWRSKVFDMSPRNFAAVRVEADWSAGLSAEALSELAQARNAVIAANVTALANYVAPDGRILSGVNGGIGLHGDTDYGLACDGLAPVPAEVPATSTVDVKVLVDGAIKYVKRVKQAEPFRLPMGYQGRSVQVEMAGTLPIKKIIAGTSVGTLAE